MLTYILRRLLLLPLTLFCIILVNFVIINLAPGDPYTQTELSPQGMAIRKDDRAIAFGADDRYLQFREFYGLTLPILFNNWSNISLEKVQKDLWMLVHRKEAPEAPEMAVKDYDDLRIKFGDQSRFIMPKLLTILLNPQTPRNILEMASRFFIRGGTQQGFVGSHLTEQQKIFNRKIGSDNFFLRSLVITSLDPSERVQDKIAALKKWYDAESVNYQFEPTQAQKWAIFFFDTRFYRYFSRVLTLDFGTLRNDQTKSVIDEVTRRFKYSLTLAILPMIVTFCLCQIFGFLMAYKQNQWQDLSINFVFLILYAIPIFVVAPFLIEKVGLNHYFPFTSTPIPISGFTSPDYIYNQKNSFQRIVDVFSHIALPLMAIIYGTLAASSRLSRTAVLEVLRQDYVRTAKAKGSPTSTILVRDVGRNASITIVTALAGSLGAILGGSLIVETLFDINGYGKFFYDGVINRDYNVIMFSTLAGSLLTLIGYLAADIAYTLLDPRVTLD
ncbi:ABC transporter permease [Parachlamydia acanthamoebae]|uniref:Dipeptide transport system permease protein dppB n=2 Tax=Parachlamydia acanthamoebae TaxID=83552 RepID=F8L1Q9_PARAV|nr:ABC transporter permease [Parachlamydia acanthamoebae]KIA77069.1 Dipeptide transport system permease protein DppB [Parachlamydia acanthamoebae]CCB87215.1 dipeptide transport system permease protein dppB [Parachlamydia acanthamoebae UV-7]